HPVGPAIMGGLIAHPFDCARDMLRFFRDRTASLPDEHVIFGGLIHAPDGSGTKLAAMVTCHCGSPAAGEKAMRARDCSGLRSSMRSVHCRIVSSTACSTPPTRRGRSTTGNRAS